MKNILLAIPFFLTLLACSNNPVGHIVSETSTNTFNIKFPGEELRVGDKVRILDIVSNYSDESAPPAKTKTIGEGRVSTILKGHYYEITTKSAQHIPTGSFVEKL